MTTTLTAPSAPYGQFDERGYHFEARIPAGPHEERAFLLTVARDDVPLLELLVPMVYAPVFGVDVGDTAALEAATDKLLQLLPDGAPAEADFERLSVELGARRATPSVH